MMALVVESFWRRLRYTCMRDVLRGRLDGQLDWRYLLAEADLPAEITDTIFQVVNKTRLWNGERIDVVQELAAHFQDGLETGRSAETLVAQFGDVDQTAALIRRAKKRNRSLWWKTLRAFSWSLGCFLVVYVLLALYMFTERPTLDTDYLAIVNRRADARVQGEAAWPHYRKAMFALGWRNAKPPKIFQGPWYQVDIDNLLNGNKDEGLTVREFLTEHQPQLAELRKATAAPRLGFTLGQPFLSEDAKPLESGALTTTPDGEPPEMISILMGHVQVLRDAGILLAGDALLAAESGDAQRAHENLAACLRMVRHVQDSPFLISGLVSFAIERRSLDAIENILRDHPEIFSDEQLVALAHRVAAIEPPMNYWLESEQTLMFDTMQRIYGDSGRVTHEGALYLGHLEEVVHSFDDYKRGERAHQVWLGIGLPAINLLVASRDEQLAMYNEIWQDELAKISTPLWQLTRKESQIDRLSRSPWEQKKYLPIVLVVPAIDVARMEMERSAGRREGAQIGIALELYRRELGGWPESLKRLSPRWLPRVPVDRINGGPLGYLASADGVVVYSLGTDTDDDQGRPPLDGASPYRVYLPSPITEEASPQKVREEDGDWVIWSTVSTNAEIELQDTD